MDICEAALEAVYGLPVIYNVGFIPEKSSFVELTPEQYSIYYAQGGDISRKVYAVVPKTRKLQASITVVQEGQIPTILKAGAFLKSMAKKSGRSFRNDSDLLEYVLRAMPEIGAIAIPQDCQKTAG